MDPRSGTARDALGASGSAGGAGHGVGGAAITEAPPGDAGRRHRQGRDEATGNLERLVLGKRVRLRISDEDRDGYGRLLRYVDVGGVDAGLRQIEAGLAVARYDSRDGYGYHPRENRYIAADKASPDKRCGQP